MPFFKKRPFIIEAWKFTGEDGRAWPDWLHTYQSKYGEVCSWYAGKLLIPTLEGRLTAEVGDWIIKGIKGELYPCKSDIFELTYEEVDQ